MTQAQRSFATEAATTAVIRNDRVQADLRSLADKHTATPFLRTAMLGQNGLYAVVITYPDGHMRMEGHYLDATLTIPDGTFTYYYPNGRMESTGAFVHGIKSGTWKCETADGKPRADRIYHGMDWDDLQVFVGVSERAATLGSSVTENVAQWERAAQ